MALKSLITNVVESALTEEIVKRVVKKGKLSINGGSTSAKAITISSLALKSNKPVLVIVPTLEEASRWNSIMQILGWNKVLLYPSSEVSPYESIEISKEIEWAQLSVLSELLANDYRDPMAIICTERALQPHLPRPELMLENSVSIIKGNELNLDNLSRNLIKIGYEKTTTTEQEGTWSRRGDIIDIFAVNNELPIRIELFGDNIDKIREFDPINQRSLDEINNIRISPVSINKITFNNLSNNELKRKDNNIKHEIEGTIEELLEITQAKDSTLMNYIHKDSLICIDEKKQCVSHNENWINHLRITFNELMRDNTLKDNNSINILNYNDKNQINSLLEDFKIIEMSNDSISINQDESFHLNSSKIVTYPNQFSKISELIREFQKKKYSIWLLSAQPSRASALLEEHECITKFVQNNLDISHINSLIEFKTPVSLKLHGNIDIEGVDLSQWKVLLLTDKELFGQQIVSSTGFIRKRRSSSSRSVNPNKLKSGDYVVHRNHGVGKFLKIEKFIVNNESRDYLLVQYSDGTLRVAADQLSSLGRYRNSSDKSPRINKLGGNTWTKAKERAKKSISRVAIDLIKLYAERSNSQGFSFPKDGPWQRELEEAFPYEATPDQIKAVSEIKSDMEKSFPMDRLVCGDVGFGKTEVAIRALFKAITAGKQVAILAPTTVLAQQHWRTLTDRFAPYPIKVSLLNRFKSSSEKKEIAKSLKNGTIDAIVGTHLLLSKNIEYKDLGLLVVDEEQRFGVNQKEKIKSLKKNIDVLTLTATPIPRTLYMSLSGVREMSLITTPPPQRRAIKTHLVSKENEIIRSAICQEIGRGGQIFYVVPRIEGIEEVATEIKQMVPNIKLIIAHGQMNEGELENAMIAFNAGEADLMLCTTIIESGLDIPRVNTILIEDAHKFGLSQLYQLRGRVGRSGVQAHAWLFFPQDKEVTNNASQRLKAIQEFSELGSGYQLAMRDMEIRGVGNLIGIQQSGQMEIIGFDLYMEILHESIAEIQGQTIPVVEETKVDLPITAFIPNTWIKSNEEKLTAYKQASECSTIDKLLELTAIWIDRYGVLPAPVEALILIMKLKIKSKACGFSRIRLNKPNIVLETMMNESTFSSLRDGLEGHLHGRVIYKAGQSFSEVTLRGLGILPLESHLETIIEWLENMSNQLPYIDSSITNIIRDKLT
ncbi:MULTISPECIES: transcription-repair coupling factor [Prochlorococcus]|uniref:Transcription-repair-coupling factor n=1 Tax=Prochlorococcus marinus (strain SARG / CCMP1375 / SS120) TaxID=167539 RepID=Q7VBU2_PROMA|nr:MULTISPECIES: transcription-repair coupling factor [Prochlorococcus]AAQ00045.1 Transcription-repair coupling factor [Prochlorococcus marinus subsp. marinus str. CCMP1375]KGG13842.1 Transcription-repair coupling factor [Prochlorococcus marinus str. LG]KGG18976.1 Transcription-repair coupling factor [Prochlorococcus marinus str. SS2]KGG23485.1 Transcription-repair coupling factor [Prochlorococcus marinus str. SS35]KGG32279.1 Transcription-repair coupling factor [Prochlorococcus marinus str. S